MSQTNDPRPLVEQAEAILELAFAVSSENPVYRSHQQKELIDAARKLHAALAAEPAPVTQDWEKWEEAVRQIDAMGAATLAAVIDEVNGDPQILERVTRKALDTQAYWRQYRAAIPTERLVKAAVECATPSAGGEPGQVEGCPCWACNENWPEAPGEGAKREPDKTGGV